jgi:hypothetical protein
LLVIFICNFPHFAKIFSFFFCCLFAPFTIPLGGTHVLYIILHRSTLHRVLGNGQERYSVSIYFFLLFSFPFHVDGPVCLLNLKAPISKKLLFAYWQLHSFSLTFCFGQIAYFVEPSYDCLVECLPTCKSEKNPPK